MNNFFSYDLEDGFKTHKTLEGAKESAKIALDLIKSIASECGWPSEAAEICYGKITGATVEVSCDPDSPHVERRSSATIAKRSVIIGCRGMNLLIMCLSR